MTYAKLEAIARNLDQDQIQADLRSLCNDPRMAALLRLLIDEKDKIADSACGLKFADHHGCLAHAQGGRAALLELQNFLRGCCTPDRPKRKTTPEPDDDVADVV